jgi:hypothetical protein
MKMKIQYPRLCACCSFSAKSQQSWSQHIKTKKHAEKEYISKLPGRAALEEKRKRDWASLPPGPLPPVACPVAEPVCPPVPVAEPVVHTQRVKDSVDVETLLAIIKSQAATIATQSITIQQLQMKSMMVVDTPPPVTPVQPAVVPNITLNVTERSVTTKDPPVKVVKEEKPPPDTCTLNVSDVLEKDFYITPNVTQEMFRDWLVNRFLKLDITERPIRYYKNNWQYRENSEWVSLSNKDTQNHIKNMIDKRINKQWLDMDENCKPTEYNITSMTLLSSFMDSIEIFGANGLTQSNCKV